MLKPSIFCSRLKRKIEKAAIVFRSIIMNFLFSLGLISKTFLYLLNQNLRQSAANLSSVLNISAKAVFLSRFITERTAYLSCKRVLELKICSSSKKILFDDIKMYQRVELIYCLIVTSINN